MKKMLVIVEKTEVQKYRTKRIQEEAEKRGCEVDLVVSNNITFFANRVVNAGREIDFSEYDAIYSIGNGDRHHYLLLFASLRCEAKIWPSTEHFWMNDKFFEGMFFESLDIRFPKTILLTSQKKESVDKVAEELGGYPCIIKKVTGSEGIYVGLVHSHDEVCAFLEKLPHPSITGKKSIILQQYIAESRGTDFRVYCVGKEILGAIKRTSASDDFRANVSLGGKAESVELSDDMIKFSKKIMQKGNLLFAGIDYIMSDDGLMVVEVNTSADFRGFELATGINVAGKIIDQFLK